METHVPWDTFVFGGDFNCIENRELDKAGDDAQAGDKGSVELKDFVDSVSLCDVFRVKFPQRKLFTRHNNIIRRTLICRGLIEFMLQKV